MTKTLAEEDDAHFTGMNRPGLRITMETFVSTADGTAEFRTGYSSMGCLVN
jgi:hypothetical protein